MTERLPLPPLGAEHGSTSFQDWYTRITRIVNQVGVGGAPWQPLDSDLTAIAALATTAFGRSLLTLIDLNALQALIGSPTTYTLSADTSTAADTNPVDLPGLEFTFEPNSTYVFRWVGNVSPTANTTGVGFQLSVA
jgi:hypothetical protein